MLADLINLESYLSKRKNSILHINAIVELPLIFFYRRDGQVEGFVQRLFSLVGHKPSTDDCIEVFFEDKSLTLGISEEFLMVGLGVKKLKYRT